jgi:DNA-binding IclR family transcriptional regulator
MPRGRPKSPLREVILDQLEACPAMTTREVAYEADISRARAFHFLTALEREGLVERKRLAPLVITWSLTAKALLT